MKNRLLVVLAVAVLLLSGYRARAADPSAAAAELKDLVTRVIASLQQGQRTEADQAAHLKEFDALLAKHKGETNDDVAEIAFMKATIYLEIFQQTDKGSDLLKQLQRDFPNSAPAKRVDQVLASIKQGQEAKKIQDALAVDSAFPDFEVKDLDGKPLSVSGYKGKVVMVDFWATWCGPCVGEVPNVAKVYEKYHDKGFEIIGVSLDRAADKGKLISFTQQNKMPWRQFFDGGYWTNQLAVKYGIESIPAAFLLDGAGKIVAKGDSIRGEDLEPAVAKALGIKVEGVLAPDTLFPDFDVKDLDGKPLSVAGYKGKVVMIDFWATWCGPCVGEVPNVVKVYEKYHDKGFEIIGVSLDREGDRDKLISFTQEHHMPWRQYYDGKFWSNDLAVKYNIRSIPATFLLDGSGRIIARNVRGEALEPAVKKALGVSSASVSGDMLR